MSAQQPVPSRAPESPFETALRVRRLLARLVLGPPREAPAPERPSGPLAT